MKIDIMIDKKVNHARKLLTKIDQEINDIEFVSDDRNRISAALFHTAFDHTNAIILLIENGIYSSAYVLARPLFEVLVRAFWFLNCATDDDISYFVEKDKFKSKHDFGKMLKCVEKKKDWPNTLTKMWEKVHKVMHSYIHGGLALVSRKITPSTIEFIIDKEEINDLICLSEVFGFLSFNEMIMMSKINGCKNEVLKNMEKTVEACFPS